MKLGQLIKIIMGYIIKKSFVWFEGLGSKSRPILLTAINQKSIIESLWYFILLTVCTETIKMIKHHQLEIKKLHFWLFYQNHKQDLELVSSIQTIVHLDNENITEL